MLPVRLLHSGWDLNVGGIEPRKGLLPTFRIWAPAWLSGRPAPAVPVRWTEPGDRPAPQESRCRCPEKARGRQASELSSLAGGRTPGRRLGAPPDGHLKAQERGACLGLLGLRSARRVDSPQRLSVINRAEAEGGRASVRVNRGSNRGGGCRGPGCQRKAPEAGMCLSDGRRGFRSSC